MANTFLITISAVDKVTAVVRGINASMDRMTGPFRQISTSARALGKEMGFDKVGKSIGNIGKSAADLGGKLSSLAAPLAVIVGGGTLAGIAALATEWGRLGSEISRSAATIGTSSASLQSLRGAAQAAGLSASDLTGGLKGLGDTMQDALYGRNQQALVMLNRLGVGIHHTASGSVDAARGFRDLSTSISGIKSAQVQALVARTFGLEALLPLLRQGPAAIDAYERKVAELGGVMSESAVRAAESFGLSLNYLSIATQGLRNTIGEKLMPLLQPMIERFTNWIAVNRELIAADVGKFVEGIVHWIDQLDFNKIGNDIKSFGASVEHVVESLGGWKNAALAVVVVINGSLIAGVINLGLAVGNLAFVSIPPAIRALGLLATGLQTVMVAGLRSAAIFLGLAADAAGAIPGVATVLGGLASAFAGVSAVIAATPIGWLIAGMAAIAVSVYAIYKNWDGISGYFKNEWKEIKDAFNRDWVEGVLKVLSEFNPLKWVMAAMNGLSKWLFDFDLYDAGSHAIDRLMQGMKAAAASLPKSVLKFLGIEAWTKSIVVPSVGQVAATSAAPAAVQTSAPGSGAPIGIRNNNPGNLRVWGKVPRDAKGYAVFPTPQAGLAAMIQNLQAQQDRHGLNTITQIISKWAPPSENDTGAYIADMSKKTGFDPNQRLDLKDQKTVAPLISGIVKHEGNAAGFSQEMINTAVAAQLGGQQGQSGQAAGTQKVEVALTLHGLPDGTRASAKMPDGNAIPVRVSYTMPTAVTP